MTASDKAAAVQKAKLLHVHQAGIVFVPGAKLQVQETIDNKWLVVYILITLNRKKHGKHKFKRQIRLSRVK